MKKVCSKITKKLKLLILLWAFIATVQAEKTDHLTALKNSQYHLVHSNVAEHDYHVFVEVPQHEPGQKLPVVYLLDGGNLFPMLVTYSRYLSITDEIPPVVLVGISYGTDDWRKGNMRSRDYTMPAKDRDHYGGAEKFHRFLVEELKPMIESNYPVDVEKSLIMGHSIGGQFALYSTLFQPDSFFGHIASNPAIHRNLEQFTQDIQANKSTKLFILQAADDDERFRLPRQQWLNHWKTKPRHWQQKVMTISGHNHMSSVPAAYRHGLKWLLESEIKEESP